MELYANLRSAADVLRSAVARTRDENLSFVAASVSFYAFFSAIPVVILALAVGSAVAGEGFESALLSTLADYLSPEGEAVVVGALDSSSGRLGASLVGVAALFWGALKVFLAVDVAFDGVYGSEGSSSLLRSLRDAVVTLTSISLGMALVVVVGLGLSRFEGGIPYGTWISASLLFLGLGAVFLPMYYVMPPRDVGIRNALPGTVTAVLGWHLLQSLFGVYAGVAGRYQAYGLLGAVLLFLLWLYLGAYVLLFGAVVNAVLEER